MRRDGETTPERSRAYRGASRLALYGALLAVKVTVTAGSLHETIDREIDAAPGGAFAEPCDDATFLRRVHLDLGGIIPTAAGTRGSGSAAPAFAITEWLSRTSSSVASV